MVQGAESSPKGIGLDRESSLSYVALTFSLMGGISEMTPKEMETEASQLMQRGFH
jgi:hypothetical protein